MFHQRVQVQSDSFTIRCNTYWTPKTKYSCYISLLPHFPTDIDLVLFDQDSKKNGECLKRITEVASLRCAFELFDANFFNDKKVTLYNL